MRRLLILGLALSVAGLGPVPLSACALLTSQMAECKTPETQPTCDKMNMREDGPELVAASNGSCCFVSRAPVQQAQQKISDYSSATSITNFEPIKAESLPQGVAPAPRAQDSSPPPLRSLLCTFLI